jgi:hypothetical protein
MKFSIKYLIYFLISLSTSTGMVIKKCCAPAERFNVETKACVPNINGVLYKINFMELTITKQGWISNIASGSYSYTQISEKCAGILKTEHNYRVTQDGKLINYAGDNQSYYEFYNDFCVDVDYKTGESIAIICENKKVVKKCCEKTLRLQEDGDGEFSCHHTDDPIFLNDISEIFTPDGKSSENYKFTENSIESFTNYSKIVNFRPDQFQFDEDLLITFENETDFCLDKLEDRWIILLKDKMDNRITSNNSCIDAKENSSMNANNLFSNNKFCITIPNHKDDCNDTERRVILFFSIMLNIYFFAEKLGFKFQINQRSRPRLIVV